MTTQFNPKIAPQGHFRCHPGDRVVWFITDIPVSYLQGGGVTTFMVCEAKTPQLAQELVHQLNQSINYTEQTANMSPLQKVFSLL